MNSLESYFSLALWLAGIGHFCVLGASFQVPHRLQWKTDLPKLLPLNRKLMWTYGFFTVGNIIGFGLLTLLFHNEMLRGDRAALGIATFIGCFWTARLLVDCFYFSHGDWPEGLFFKIGHVLLVFLFICLAGTYLGLVIWRLIIN
jgi:hypothetical protein